MPDQLPLYSNPYMHHVTDAHITEVLSQTFGLHCDFLMNFPTQKLLVPYAKGKWTPNEVLQHIVDTERIMSYRALRFARNDQSPLSMYDDLLYVEESDANLRKWEDLIREWIVVRESTQMLFNQFSDSVLLRKGNVENKYIITVEQVGLTIAGHGNHHIEILKERY